MADKQELLKLSYEDKIKHCKQVIKDFLHLCEDPITGKYINEPLIAFSGGKDSLALAHMVRSIDPNIKVVTSAEQFHPENVKIIKEWNAEVIPGRETFFNFIDKYGLVAFGKEISQNLIIMKDNFKFKSEETRARRLAHFEKRYKKYANLPKDLINEFTNKKCCDYVKGNVKHLKNPMFVGTTIYESQIRKINWLKKGCIDWNNKKCTPISILSDNDVWRYIKENNIHYSKAYDMGWSRTGCLCCPMGIQFKKRRKELLLVKKYYPNIYEQFYKRFKKLIEIMGYDELKI